jgi:hypothetical protein
MERWKKALLSFQRTAQTGTPSFLALLEPAGITVMAPLDVI